MRTVIAAVACVSLAACVTTYEAPRSYVGQPAPAPAAPGTFGMNKTTGGALLGAAGGGLLGNQFGHGKGKTAMTVLGVLAGGLIGSQIGASLDRADQAALHQTTQTALETAPTGQPLPWQNPDSGNHGTVTPQAPYQTADGRYCREFTQTIVVGGQQQQGYGRACREPDGTWKLVQ